MADELVLGIVAHGLPGAVVDLPSAPLPPPRWSALLDAARNRRVAGHLLRAVEDGALPVTDEQLAQVVAAHREAMALVLLIERSLVEAVDLLDRHGLDYRVLKGAALAHTCYDDPSLRVYGDVDLLASSDSIDATVALLREAGYRRPYPQLRDGFDRRFGKAITLVASTGLQIDLHRTFLMGPYGLLVDTAALFETSEEFSVGGRIIRALDRAGQTLHAAYAVALGDTTPKPGALRDLAELLLTGPVATERILSLADRSQGSAVLARGVVVTWDRLRLADTIPLSVWAQRYEPSRRETQLMRSYAGARRSYAATSYDALRVLPTLRERAAYLQAVTLPGPAFRSARGVSPLSWVRKGSRSMLGRDT